MRFSSIASSWNGTLRFDVSLPHTTLQLLEIAMSRDADILFCKIAITAGMISQPQAQKVLGFIDRRERETGRRPIVGAVFEKHQLMSPQQVQKVKAAVARRTGGAMPVAVHAPKTREGRGRKSRQLTAAKRPVDQQTLVMGAGFGVLFVGVVITICYLFLTGGSRQVASDGTSEPQQSAGGLEPRGTVPGGSASPLLEAPVALELPRQIRLDIDNKLSDITRDQIDSPRRARTTLQTLKADLQVLRNRRYSIPPEVETRLSDVESGLASVEAEATAAAPSGQSVPSGLSETGERTPESPPPPPAPTGDAANASGTLGDDLDLDDLDDLDLEDF